MDTCLRGSSYECPAHPQSRISHEPTRLDYPSPKQTPITSCALDYSLFGVIINKAV